jgi:hypothetical protein
MQKRKRPSLKVESRLHRKNAQGRNDSFTKLIGDKQDKQNFSATHFRNQNASRITAKRSGGS